MFWELKVQIRLRRFDMANNMYYNFPNKGSNWHFICMYINNTVLGFGIQIINETLLKIFL